MAAVWASGPGCGGRNEAEYEQGTRINFFPPPGLAPFLADSVEARLELTLRPASQMRLSPIYIYNRLGAAVSRLKILQGEPLVELMPQLLDLLVDQLLHAAQIANYVPFKECTQMCGEAAGAPLSSPK